MWIRRIEAILARTFVVIVVSVVTFLVADFISVGFISGRAPIEQQFPVEVVRQPRPYTMFGGAPDEGGHNALGYPGQAPDVPKPAGEFRVFMLGGSTVYRGAPPLAVLLEQAFAAHGSGQVRVYNAGVVSSNSAMDLVRLVVDLAELEPDLVVMFNGGNDILSPWVWDPRPGYPFNFIAYENNPLLENEVRSYPSLAMLAYGSNLLRAGFRSQFVDAFVPLDAEREACGWNTDPWRDEIARVYLGNLRKASMFCRGFGAEFAAFFQPLVYFKGSLTPGEQIKARNSGGIADNARAVRERIVAGLEVADPAFHLVDLSGLYEQTTDAVFEDYIHTRQEQKPAIAAAMFRYLSVSLNVPTSPGD